MVCKACGREIENTAKYCDHCGSSTKAPVKKSEKKGEKNEPGIFLRILFMLCAMILICHTVGTFAVGICGTDTVATDIKLSFNKKEPNGNSNDYQWWLDYHYSVDGKDYSGYTMWHGTRWSPDSGTGKYHINYLPFLPQVSRFEKYNSLINAKKAEDIIFGGFKTLFATAAGMVAAYLLICLSFPSIPFFGFGKSKKKKKKRKNKKLIFE